MRRIVSNADPDFAGFGQGVERIANQIQQNLLDLDPIDEHRAHIGGDGDPASHAARAGVDRTEAACLLGEFSRFLDRPLQFAVRHELAQAMHYPPRAQGFLARSLERFVHRLRRPAFGSGEQGRGSLNIVRDGHERLVQFMRQCGCHGANRTDA